MAIPKGNGTPRQASMRGFEIDASDIPLMECIPLPFVQAMQEASTSTESYAELAARLQISVGTLKSRLNRGRAMLVRMRAVADNPDLSPDDRAKAMKKAKTHVEVRKSRAA